MLRKGGFSGFYMEGNCPTADVDSRQWTVRTSLGRKLQDVGWGDRFRDRAVVAIHRGQRVAVDFRSGRQYRRRARPFRDGLILCGVFLLTTNSDLIGDFENWWNNATGAVGQAWQDVKNFVHSTVHAAVSLVTGGLNLVDYAFTVTTNSILSFAQSVWNFANAAYQWVLAAAGTVGGWIDNAWNWFYAEIIAPALGFLGDAINFGIGALQWAVNEVNAGISWLVDNIIDPVWNWVVGAAETVWGWAQGWFNDFYQMFIAPIVSEAEAAYHLLDTVWDWFWNKGVAAVDLIEKAWDWLYWMATHAFMDFWDLPDEILNGVSLKWAEQQARDSESVIDEFAGKVVAWFG